MTTMTNHVRRFAIFFMVVGLLSTSCAKSPSAPASAEQPVNLKIDPLAENEYDEMGWPIDRNRQEGKGSTQIQDDGTEELIIPLRERFFEDDPVMPRVVGS